MDGSTALDATWIVIHLVGITAAIVVRSETTGYRQRLAQGSFLACLPIIAIATVVGEYFCLAFWPLSACTLGVMIVTAVVDIGPRDHQSQLD